jgi:hypothetical protein
VFDAQTLRITSYLWFGAGPSERLPALGDKITRHTRGRVNAARLLRTNHRIVNKNRFEVFDSVERLIGALFGDLSARQAGFESSAATATM